MESIYFLCICICLVVLPAVSLAEVQLPVVSGGLHTLKVFSHCRDDVTGESGQCMNMVDDVGNTFHIFKQDGVVMFIRKTFVDAPYITIYLRRNFFGTY